MLTCGFVVSRWVAGMRSGSGHRHHPGHTRMSRSFSGSCGARRGGELGRGLPVPDRERHPVCLPRHRRRGVRLAAPAVQLAPFIQSGQLAAQVRTLPVRREHVGEQFRRAVLLAELTPRARQVAPVGQRRGQPAGRLVDLQRRAEQLGGVPRSPWRLISIAVRAASSPALVAARPASADGSQPSTCLRSRK